MFGPVDRAPDPRADFAAAAKTPHPILNGPWPRGSDARCPDLLRSVSQVTSNLGGQQSVGHSRKN